MFLDEFFSQDPKKIQQDLLNAGFSDSRQLHCSVSEFVERLGLEGSGIIDYIYCDCTSKRTILHIEVCVPLNEKLKPYLTCVDYKTKEYKPFDPRFEVHMMFTSKCKVKRIYLPHEERHIEIVSYHQSKSGIPFTYSIHPYGDAKNIPFVIESIFEVVNSYKYVLSEVTPYIEKAIDMCESGRLIDTYNKYFSKKYNELGYLDKKIHFFYIVDLLRFFKKTFNKDISETEVIAYTSYLNDNTDMEKKIILGEPINIEIPSSEDFDNVLSTFIETHNPGKTTKWVSTYTDANKELRQEYEIFLKNCKEKISKKYNIPENYLSIDNYDLVNDKVHNLLNEVPDDVKL